MCTAHKLADSILVLYTRCLPPLLPRSVHASSVHIQAAYEYEQQSSIQKKKVKLVNSSTTFNNTASMSEPVCWMYDCQAARYTTEEKEERKTTHNRRQ